MEHSTSSHPPALGPPDSRCMHLSPGLCSRSPGHQNRNQDVTRTWLQELESESESESDDTCPGVFVPAPPGHHRAGVRVIGHPLHLAPCMGEVAGTIQRCRGRGLRASFASVVAAFRPLNSSLESSQRSGICETIYDDSCHYEKGLRVGTPMQAAAGPGEIGWCHRHHNSILPSLIRALPLVGHLPHSGLEDDPIASVCMHLPNSLSSLVRGAPPASFQEAPAKDSWAHGRTRPNQPATAQNPAEKISLWPIEQTEVAHIRGTAGGTDWPLHSEQGNSPALQCRAVISPCQRKWHLTTSHHISIRWLASSSLHQHAEASGSPLAHTQSALQLRLKALECRWKVTLGRRQRPRRRRQVRGEGARPGRVARTSPHSALTAEAPGPPPPVCGCASSPAVLPMVLAVPTTWSASASAISPPSPAASVIPASAPLPSASGSAPLTAG